MATISNTPRPGYVYDSTDAVWYPIGTGTHSHSEIASTIVDAKGDIITASAADTPARLAVGNNGETLVADSSTSTGLRYTENYDAGKNLLINGNLAVNQRNFTSNTTSSTFNFDRFWQLSTGGGTLTVTPQVLAPATILSYGGTNYVRCVTASQSAVSDYAIYSYRGIEDVRLSADQTVTISFYAKANSGTPKIGVELDQSFGTPAISPSVTTAMGTVTLSTSWARYTVTGTVPSVSGKTINPGNCTTIYFWLSAGSNFNSRTGSIGNQNNTFEMTGFQYEIGSVATAFNTATGTLQGELAACQRYYVRWGGGSVYEFIGLGTGATSTVASINVNMPVQMRVPPTSIDYSTLSLFDGTSTITSVVPTIVASYSGTKIMGIDATVASGVTVNRPYRLITNNSTSGFLGLSAEL